jgi:C4-dicarboxylate transporter, DctM subunit
VLSATGALVGFVVALALMLAGFHIGVVLAAVALYGAWYYLGPAIVQAFGTQLYGSMDDSILLSIPMYILLGEILVRGGATDRMYQALALWFNRLPGGLLHSNVGASALFSAVSGSSVATAATISTVALPAFKSRNYDQRLVLGSIAAGASLGNLIPPGVAFIVYGVITNTSIGKLYAAGTVPGILMTLIFMATIVMIALARPHLVGRERADVSWGEKVRALPGLVPPLVVFAVIMGSIYTGWATVTESAALAVAVAMPFAWLNGRLSVRMLHDCFLSTFYLTAISMFILAAAFFLNFVMGLLGVPQTLAKFAGSLQVEQLAFLWMLAVFYLLLGIFFETLPMLVGTVPIMFPIVVAMGVDPIWFGVFIVLMCEISLISPPVGMTLYVIQGVRREGSIAEVFQGTLPFFLAMIVMTGLLIHFPQLALWFANKTWG